MRSVLKLVPLAALLWFTNPGTISRFAYLIDRAQFGTLLPYCAIWGFTILAVLMAAFHSKTWVRIFWGLIIAASTAMSWGYYQVSGSYLSVFDMMTIWNEGNDVGRATSFFSHQITLVAVLFVALLSIFIFRPPHFEPRIQTWINRLVLLPVLPIAMIAGIFWLKNVVAGFDFDI
jgi:glucan phosphoethanolaminetransferase (alkaline phosphatase superfamily)